MNTVLIPDERNRDQKEYHDQNDALFVRREFENFEQALHVMMTQL